MGVPSSGVLQVALQGTSTAAEPYQALAAVDRFMLTAKDWVGQPGRQLQYEFRFQQVCSAVHDVASCIVWMHLIEASQLEHVDGQGMGGPAGQAAAVRGPFPAGVQRCANWMRSWARSTSWTC